MNRPWRNDLARRLWAGQLHDAGALLSGMLLPAEWAYRAVVGLRNRAYDVRLLGTERAEIPVVSTGNIAVGGTGKTPFAHWLALELRSRGHVPAVLHGGYAADEPELHRRWSPDLLVVVGRDRVASVRHAQRAGATVAVLDDAFQHRRLHRDLDIVLISAERWSEAARLLPRGPWREARSALARADLIVCTRKVATAAAAAEAAAEAARLSHRPVAIAHLHPDGWRSGSGSSGAPRGAALAVAALAEPDFFVRAARAAGAAVADIMTFPDHHAYTPSDAASIRERAAARVVVTTEKDWTKLDRLLDPDQTWLLRQAITIEAGAELIADALDRIQP